MVAIRMSVRRIEGLLDPRQCDAAVRLIRMQCERSPQVLGRPIEEPFFFVGLGQRVEQRVARGPDALGIVKLSPTSMICA